MKTLISTLILSLIFVASSHAYPKKQIETDFRPGNGTLCFNNYHTGEILEIKYRSGNRYNPAALKEIQHVFRSRSDEKEHVIDVKLIELLDNIQDHFGADCIELISGYRSPELNNALRKKGVNAAEESLHMEGKAADIHIDEVTEEALMEYARSLKVGGVGFYPKWDFVHVDTGDVRKWDLPDSTGRLLIAFRRSPVWQVTTDRNIYLPNEQIEYEIMNITRTPKGFDKTLLLQLFRRGKWETIKNLDHAKGKLRAGGSWRTRWAPADDDGFGKYRIIIPGPKGFPYLMSMSNEFYRKKF